jgi:hypothetical protein
MAEKSKIQRTEASSEGFQGPEGTALPQMEWNGNINMIINIFEFINPFPG